MARRRVQGGEKRETNKGQGKKHPKRRPKTELSRPKETHTSDISSAIAWDQATKTRRDMEALERGLSLGRRGQVEVGSWEKESRKGWVCGRGEGTSKTYTAVGKQESRKARHIFANVSKNDHDQIRGVNSRQNNISSTTTGRREGEKWCKRKGRSRNSMLPNRTRSRRETAKGTLLPSHIHGTKSPCIPKAKNGDRGTGTSISIGVGSCQQHVKWNLNANALTRRHNRMNHRQTRCVVTDDDDWN